jgi:two-component system phosphate regulon response regulator OmpR
MSDFNFTALRATGRQILVVDQDLKQCSFLQRYLRHQGFDVAVATDSVTLRTHHRQASFDLILLEVEMPDIDGMAICQRMRSIGDETPIILLSDKCDYRSRIKGLNIGADDYVIKPFNPAELLARIKAVLRRCRAQEHHGAPSTIPELVRFGPYQLNLASRSLSRNGVTLPITTGEFAMLKVLVRHANKPLTRDRLMELARGREYEAFDRSLDVRISRLRKLIEPQPTKPIYIQTVWGVGYAFVPDAQPCP